jgi:hypothetical protein
VGGLVIVRSSTALSRTASGVRSQFREHED